MSYDLMVYGTSRKLFFVSIPLEQGNVLRLDPKDKMEFEAQSQSLWNRAMSYDTELTTKQYAEALVSIPLEQGNVLRQKNQR